MRESTLYIAVIHVCTAYTRCMWDDRRRSVGGTQVAFLEFIKMGLESLPEGAAVRHCEGRGDTMRKGPVWKSMCTLVNLSRIGVISPFLKPREGASRRLWPQGVFARRRGWGLHPTGGWPGYWSRAHGKSPWKNLPCSPYSLRINYWCLPLCTNLMVSHWSEPPQELVAATLLMNTCWLLVGGSESPPQRFEISEDYYLLSHNFAARLQWKQIFL